MSQKHYATSEKPPKRKTAWLCVEKICVSQGRGLRRESARDQGEVLECGGVLSHDCDSYSYMNRLRKLMQN